jgi:hypothetical protein
MAGLAGAESLKPDFAGDRTRYRLPGAGTLFHIHGIQLPADTLVEYSDRPLVVAATSDMVVPEHRNAAAPQSTTTSQVAVERPPQTIDSSPPPLISPSQPTIVFMRVGTCSTRALNRAAAGYGATTTTLVVEPYGLSPQKDPEPIEQRLN